MTTVSGPLKAVTTRQSSVVQVLVRAPAHRPHGGGIITPESVPVTINGANISFECVPGPAVLVLTWVGAASDVVRLVVPDTRTATLEECVLAGQIAGEADQSVLARLANEILADKAAVAKSVSVAKSHADTAAREAQKATSASTAARNSQSSAMAFRDTASKHADTAAREAQKAASASAAASQSEKKAANHLDEADQKHIRFGITAAAAEDLMKQRIERMETIRTAIDAEWERIVDGFNRQTTELERVMHLNDQALEGWAARVSDGVREAEDVVVRASGFAARAEAAALRPATVTVVTEAQAKTLKGLRKGDVVIVLETGNIYKEE